jgi:hypothetical protein
MGLYGGLGLGLGFLRRIRMYCMNIDTCILRRHE